jgi:uncharacterized repeat protein (TIGR03806 family)
MKKCVVLACTLFAWLLLGWSSADETPTPRETHDGADLPEGFADTILATGISGATAMEIAPDGRVFVCEQTGALRVVKDDKLLPKPFVTVPVDSYWERGLLGVALDPDFPKNQYLYLCYVTPRPYPHHRVSRFTARGDSAVPRSEVVLLEGDDQRKLGGSQPAGHQGGAIHFGKDGKLYIAIGEQTAGAPAQEMDTFQGKLLRINRDGSIPEDNPFYKTAKGKYRAIWALGLRNPFAFAVQPGTGRIFINDVGDARWEEINEGGAGANYGWPHSEGYTANPKHKGPIHAYDHTVGRSITGGAFYNPATKQFPARYVGKYFFMDYMDNWIRALDPKDPKSVTLFATGLAAPVDLKVGPDGSLYYLNRNVWVKDDKFKPNTGSLHRVSYTANSDKPAPHITKQPADVTVIVGQTVTFKVATRSASTYQWLRNGKPINGARAAKLTIASVKASDGGAQFRCLVTNRFGSTRSAPATITLATPRAPVSASHLTTGLDYRYYEGTWPALPDFNALKSVRTGSVKDVDLAPRKRDENIGFVFEGFVRVSADGAYSFHVASSGPCKLFVAGMEVASTSKGQVSGAVGLKEGNHPLSLLFAHRTGRPSLRVSYAGQKNQRAVLAEDQLFRTDPAALAAPTIDPPGGAFSGPVSVRLMTTTAKAVIRYTTDGTAPTTRSPVFREPLVLRETVTVKAKTFRGEDGEAPRLASSTFTITGKRPFGLPRRGLVRTLLVPPSPADLPSHLSQTGVFRSLADLSPNPGIIPYDVNSPLWSDGAAKRRWIALPGDARIDFRAAGEWTFPPGTVFIKHFELGTDASKPALKRRLETRLLVVGKNGAGYGATYRWRADNRDADLLTDSLSEPIEVRGPDGPVKRTWYYPSRNDCLLCHTTNAGFVLGVKTRQLNRDFIYPVTGVSDNQLRTWKHLELFKESIAEDAIPRYAQLADVSNANAPLEHRVRSYLDANCAHCHRPGGARGGFDARFDTSLARQSLLKGDLVAADLGIPNVKVITPGDPSKSMLYLRMNRRQDVFNMPPLASNVADDEAVSALAEWIKSLDRDHRKP